MISCIRRVSVTALANSRQRGKPSPVTLRSDEITLDDFAFVATAAGVDTQNESESWCEKWQPGAAELSRLRRLILQRIWVAGAVEAAIRLTLRVLREFEKRREERRAPVYPDARSSDECGAARKQVENCARNFSFFAQTLQR